MTLLIIAGLLALICGFLGLAAGMNAPAGGAETANTGFFFLVLGVILIALGISVGYRAHRLAKTCAKRACTVGHPKVIDKECVCVGDAQ